MDDVIEAFLDVSRPLVGLAVAAIERSPVEVTATQHRVLVLLATRGYLTISEIARLLDVPASSATRHVDRLERASLVVRRRSPADSRVVQVRLASAGKDVVEAVEDHRRQSLRDLVARMSPRDRSAALRGMRAFRAAAEQAAEEREAAAP